MDILYNALNMKNFNEGLSTMLSLKHEKSLALEDILTVLHKGVMMTKYTEEMKMYLISRMAEIEYRLS